MLYWDCNERKVKKIEKEIVELEEGLIEFYKFKRYIDDKIRSYQERVFTEIHFLKNYLFKFISLEFKLDNEIYDDDSFYEIFYKDYNEEIEYIDNVYVNLDYFERKEIEGKLFRGK